MKHILIVSSKKSIESIETLLRGELPCQCVAVESGGEARRLCLTASFDFILINTPLPDEFGHELAISLSESTLAGIVLMVKIEMAEDVSARVTDYGICVLPKPIQKPWFYQCIRLCLAARNRLLRLKRENDSLAEKLTEQKVVSRAKCLLIEREGFSENEAHRLLEKRAMDERISKTDAAKAVLRRYSIEGGKGE